MLLILGYCSDGVTFIGWPGLLIYFNEVVSKCYGRLELSEGVVELINVIWCDRDKDGRYYALVEDWNTGTKVCRFGDGPEQAQENARRELKRILIDATLSA